MHVRIVIVGCKLYESSIFPLRKSKIKNKQQMIKWNLWFIKNNWFQLIPVYLKS